MIRVSFIVDRKRSIALLVRQSSPGPPKACTGPDSGRYFERMESPATLLRSSKASMTTLPAVLVMVTSYLKSTLMSDMGVLCLHCFSILL